MTAGSAPATTPPASSSDPSASSSPRQALFKLLADVKWWLPVVSTLISISLLTKYLWVIHHPELILSSLGNPSNLVAWLFFSLLVFASLLLIVSVPSLVFTFSISICAVDRELEKGLASRFGLIVVGGYLLLSLNLLGALFDYVMAPVYFFPIVVVAAILALVVLLRRNAILHSNVLELPPGPRKPWHRRLHYTFLVVWLGTLLAFTSMTGVMPAQLAIMTWRGAETGIEALGAIGLCLLMMCLYLAPVLVFYLANGDAMPRTVRAAKVLLGCIFVNAMLLPALLDLWVYSAANLIKIRDNTELSYVLSEKDYPKEIFSSAPWQLESYEGSSGLYGVRAFRQFRFGDTLLICPASDRNITLKEIDRYAHRCIALSDAKVHVAAPVSREDAATVAKPN
ncbi:hypothetical protein [Pseudomonas cremoricolorata]|uniref:Uncharacterized protein n=1 Tax=Pseudomonas cremoricolorata TaxID=157783 RepID=A0A089WI30_9PSED|nr:hypothetical protein [Pseudomonas cremoricolorata]AIR88241.1 hypothetical protein LK03_02845 [Pseudomonas cremoricolorata]